VLISIHLWAEVTAGIDWTSTVAADLSPTGNHARRVFTQSAHLLTRCTKTCRRRLIIFAVLTVPLHHQNDHIAFSIVPDPHLSNTKTRFDRFFQVHIARQKQIIGRREERIFLRQFFEQRSIA
jgi:hypothetical protein